MAGNKCRGSLRGSQATIDASDITDEVSVNTDIATEILPGDNNDNVVIFGPEGIPRFKSASGQKFRILIHYNGKFQNVLDAGFEMTSRVGPREGDGIAAGFATQNVMDNLEGIDDVISYEHSNPMKRELDRSVIDVGVPALRTKLQLMTPPLSGEGEGVIVAVIDSGFDFTHPAFCNFSDPNDIKSERSTRILSFWDQNAFAKDDVKAYKQDTNRGTDVELMPYGIEYTQDKINEALRTKNDPFEIVCHKPRINNNDFPGTHGTNVAGIAAGNGNFSKNKFVGVAPKANLIFVSYNSDAQLGDSAYMVDALCYIVQKAGEKKMPVVINISQGDNFGPHDGTSLLEMAIDLILETPGVAIVKSAGNEQMAQRHASGMIKQNEEKEIILVAKPNAAEKSVVDIWYGNGNIFEVSIKTPTRQTIMGGILGDGQKTAPVPPYQKDDKEHKPISIVLENTDTVEIESKADDPENKDNRITIKFIAVPSGNLERGNWSIILKAVKVANGNSANFHAWIDGSSDGKSGAIPTFQIADPNCTITIPGTSEKIITVGAHELPSSNSCQLLAASSLGPTRRGIPKPELTAPGSSITTASVCNNDLEHEILLYEKASGGTSLAAPHVTGIIALLFETNKNLTQKEIRDILLKGAKIDTKNSWGRGKLSGDIL